MKCGVRDDMSVDANLDEVGRTSLRGVHLSGEVIEMRARGVKVRELAGLQRLGERMGGWMGSRQPDPRGLAGLQVVL